jgi:regulator of nucleoside diphosphate kinase
MEKQNNQLVVTKEDYEILISCLNNMYGRAAFDRQNAQELKNELKKATLVNEADFPGDVVRLNSRVKIKSGKKD